VDDLRTVIKPLENGAGGTTGELLGGRLPPPPLPLLLLLLLLLLLMLVYW